MHVLFLHGKESGPHGSKYRSIRDAGWSVTAPDCEGIDDLTQRVNIASAALRPLAGPVVVVGSSYGGLTAALLHDALQGTDEVSKIHGHLLLAPAFHLEEARALAHCHPNTVVLHGEQDEVVPVEDSRAYADRFGCELVEVQDDHRLKASHAEILRLLEQVAGTSPTA